MKTIVKFCDICNHQISPSDSLGSMILDDRITKTDQHVFIGMSFDIVLSLRADFPTYTDHELYDLCDRCQHNILEQIK